MTETNLNETVETIPENKVAAVLQNLLLRFRSPIVWASLACKVVGVLLLMGILDAHQSEVINQLIGILLFAATGASDLNNPTNREGF